MKVHMIQGKLAVAHYERINKSAGVFANVEKNFSLGEIKHAAEGSKYKVGTLVLFGSKREQITLSGQVLEIMDEDNIMAVLEEDEE